MRGGLVSLPNSTRVDRREVPGALRAEMESLTWTSTAVRNWTVVQPATERRDPHLASRSDDGTIADRRRSPDRRLNFVAKCPRHFATVHTASRRERDQTPSH